MPGRREGQGGRRSVPQSLHFFRRLVWELLWRRSPSSRLFCLLFFLAEGFLLAPCPSAPPPSLSLSLCWRRQAHQGSPIQRGQRGTRRDVRPCSPPKELRRLASCFPFSAMAPEGMSRPRPQLKWLSKDIEWKCSRSTCKDVTMTLSNMTETTARCMDGGRLNPCSLKPLHLGGRLKDC